MRACLLGIAIVLVLGLSGPAWAADDAATHENAAAHYAQGEALLKQGQIETAATSFLAAARAAPKNQAYVDRAMTLRSIVRTRRYVATQQPSPRWLQSARTLFFFYQQNGLMSLAFEQAKQAHEKMPNETSVRLLAEGHLGLGQNVEAATLLAEHTGCSPEIALLHGIALARIGQADAARRVGLTPLAADAGPGLLYDRARLLTLLGDTDVALKTLKTCFEKTPAAGLGSMKAFAQVEKDFAALAALPAFAEVLKTATLVKTACSGGSSCAGCPMRGRCGHK